MKRVASLYLPNWSIDRTRRAERQHTPSPERAVIATAELAALKQASDAEQGGKQCDAPRNSGWRPGARWARSEAAADVRPFDRPLAGKDERAGGGSAFWAGETRADVEQRIVRMESHQRPPMREMGRRSEAAEHAFKRLPGDDGGKSSGWPEPGFAGLPGAPGGMVAIRFGGEGVRPSSIQRRRDPGGMAQTQAQSSPSPLTSSSSPRRPVGAGATTPIVPGSSNAAHADGSGDASTGTAAMCHDVSPALCEIASGPAGDRLEHAALTGSGGSLPTQCESGPNAAVGSSTTRHDAGYADSGASTRNTSPHDASALRAPTITTGPVRPTLRLVGIAATTQSPAPVLDDGSPTAIGATPLHAAPRRTRGADRAEIVPHALRPAVSAIRYPGDGPHPDKPSGGKGIGERRVVNGRVGSNDAGASVLPVAPFFDTGRSTAGTVARVCPPDTPAHPHAMPPNAPIHAPLVTVHKVGNRVEVAAACPAARMLGIECGMALTQVRAATPDVCVRDADPAGDRAVLDRLATALARRWSPGVSVSDAPPDATAGEAGLFIDLTGVAHLHGGERTMARRIVRLLARLGYDARVGIADTPAAAWALARFDAAPITTLPSEHGLSPFADYPVTALRLDSAAAELMRRLGIDRIGQLATMPRAPLVRRFGRAVATRIDQLIGAVAEPVVPVVPRDPAMVEQRLAEPILTAEPIAYWIAQLSAQLAQALAEQGRGARALVLALTRVDGEVQAIRVGFARATRDPQHMVRLLARRIELIDPGFGIEVVALHVTRDEALGPEALAGDLEEQVPDLAALVDAIVNRIGAAHLWRTRAVESDVPERSVAPAAPLDHAVEPGARLLRDDVRYLDTRGAAHPWHPRWPRPTRLLRRPEPIDHVMAELPDSYPRRFRWRGQMHQVVRGDGPERIAGEWWRRTAERQAVRDYFQVEDEAGQRFWLFRRGDGQRPETGDMTWHLHGTFG
ncbi:DUF6504 family protein [uncultured Sphingomonas sp.]|uniref:DUF6504 family protein n=1 Tax=uncultured Sphingomonas sp. TaxID=158754 RepID=UPI0025E17C5F|nr:DUF6504 family protein [uncultured Sphingomonas sp.]